MHQAPRSAAHTCEPRTESQRAYRARRKQREKSLAASPERRAEAFVDGRIDTTDGRSLRTRLIDASNGNIDALADVAPVRALLDQGCDLEAVILPTVARTMRDLPRPLKRWDGPVAAAMIRGYRLSIRGIIASPGTVPANHR
jgi:hypothetical protein